MIRTDAKKIINYMLDQAIAIGSLYDGFWISYNTLTKEFDFSNEAYCRVCFQYLEQLGYVYVIDNGDDGELFVTLKAKGIDFLESD